MTDRTLLGAAWLSAHDRREIAAFKRFLTEVGRAPVASELFQRHDPHGRVWREHIGWVPYILGHFHEYRGGFTSMHPPEGYGNVPVTAWTFPG